VYFSNLKNSLYNQLIFRFKKVTYEEFPIIHGKIHLSGSGKLRLGKSISFNSGKRSNPIGGDTRMTIAIKEGCLLEIDDFSGISNSAIICHQHIKIGKHVKIGGSVKIYDTDFHSLNYSERIHKETDIGNTKPVHIGDFCFIGAHSIILKGVHIGDKSIVGAGSVVTKSIPEGEIWAGNPARFIKNI
jgi:acetyltransferase-like isoleucine patch superfamily enzyme